MVDRRPAGLARRIGAGPGFGDEGGGGQAGGADAPFELRPQFLRRAVGDGRFPFFVGSLAFPFSWFLFLVARLGDSSPSARRRPGVQGGLRSPPWSMGVRRESRNLPRGRSRRRNAGRGPGRESPGRGLQGGAIIPLLDGSRESRSLPVSRCNGDPVAFSREGLDARQRLKRPVDQSLGETLRKGAGEPRDCPGGCAGDGKSPRKVWRGITAHTLYVFLMSGPPPVSIMPG